MANTDKGLQIWMPMTKDLHNQGLAQVSVTNNGAVYSSTGGKLGGCYVFSGTSLQYLRSNTNILSHASEFTIACWVNINSSSYYIFILKQSGIYQFSLQNNTIGYRDNATSAYTSQTINIPTGSWHHFAVTLKDKKITTYIDGQESSNFIIAGTELNDINELFIGGDNASSGRYGNCSINDFRIYSYAISPQEIKELARGKVAHYPCDSNDIFTSPNLVTGLSAGSSTTISGNTVNINGQNADTYFYLKLRRAMVSGRMYRLTCWGSGFPQGAYYNFPIAGQSNAAPGWIKIQNGGCSLIFTANDACANANNRVIMDDTNRVAGAGQISNIVLQEIGPEAFLSDISGFGGHMDIFTGITLASTTPRYDKCLQCTSSGYASKAVPISPTDKISVSIWYKPLDSYSSQKSIISCINTSTGGWGISWYYNKLRTYIKIGRVLKIIDTTKTISTNVWNHIVMTYDGSNIKHYLNGELDSTIAATGDIEYGEMPLKLNQWSDNTDGGCNCQLSDIRLYATALGEDAVQELYSLGH